MQEQDRPGFEPPAAGVHDDAADPDQDAGVEADDETIRSLAAALRDHLRQYV